MKVLTEKQTRVVVDPAARARTSLDQFTGTVTAVSRVLDKVAGLGLVLIMLLVVANIIFRVVFNSPITGTIEYVGFLTAAVIGLSLAYCAVQNAHIAVNLVVDRFPVRWRGVVDVAMHILSAVFWGLGAWHMLQYARSLVANGVVSPTTQTPFYPFVYCVGLGLLALSLVMLVKSIEVIKRRQVIDE